MKQSLRIFLLLMLSVCVSDACCENLFKKIPRAVNNFVEKFNDYDTTYIEPNKYDFAAMVQSTTSTERYTLRTDDGQSISFGPKMRPRIGPYFGWRWIFLGYTFDVSNPSFGDHSGRKDFDISFYTNLIGIDLYYRQTGTDYRIREADFGRGINTRELEGLNFGGLKSGVMGANIYYIFNNNHFSYPAAYSQSTIQRRSAGSFIAGIGYTHHTLDYDHRKLDSLLLQHGFNPSVMDSTLRIDEVSYSDLNFSLGYAYNWVPARNFLINASLSAAIAIDHIESTYDDDKDRPFWRRAFSNNYLNIDGLLRLGAVYNNSRWFAGVSYILNTYNFRHSDLKTTNMFGNLNVYIGFNFHKRK